jgi:hypothetical protein
MTAKRTKIVVWVGLLLVCSAALTHAEDTDVQKQISAIKGALPKLAIPMHDVGERFQNMYYAAKAGNWALAAYQSKHMNDAMNPAKVTKPEKYAVWEGYYKTTFEPVNKAIKAQDFKQFDKEFKAALKTCDDCHVAMGYGYIKMKQTNGPSEQGMDYSVKSDVKECVTCGW